MTDSPISLCYRVLTPFQFKGNKFKPNLKPEQAVYAQFTAEEAEELIAAGVIDGEDPAMPPSDEEERCESGSQECGPVEFHDNDGVPLCAACYASLSNFGGHPDTSTMTTQAEPGGDQQDQVAAGGAQGDAADETKLQGAQSADTESQAGGSEPASKDAPGSEAAVAGGGSPAGVQPNATKPVATKPAKTTATKPVAKKK